jgi:hypothetical protein
MDDPDFIIIGAPKAGTTSLYHYLRQHPEVYMPEHKEPHFFAYEGETLTFRGPGDDWLNEAAVTTTEEYQSLFEEAPEDAVTGESSAMYLYEEEVSERIDSYCPDSQLIAVLRDPVERAYSSYMHLRRDGREPIGSFEEAVAAEERRIEQGWAPLWHYTRMSEYADQVQRFQLFEERDQLHVFLFEDLVENTDRVVQEIFRLIGVDETFDPDTEVKYNPSGIATSQAVHDFISQPHSLKEWIKPLIPTSIRSKIARSLKRLNLKSKPELSPRVRRKLISHFRSDIFELQDNIQRDLSGWLRVDT